MAMFRASHLLMLLLVCVSNASAGECGNYLENLPNVILSSMTCPECLKKLFEEGLRSISDLKEISCQKDATAVLEHLKSQFEKIKEFFVKRHDEMKTCGRMLMSNIAGNFYYPKDCSDRLEPMMDQFKDWKKQWQSYLPLCQREAKTKEIERHIFHVNG